MRNNDWMKVWYKEPIRNILTVFRKILKDDGRVSQTASLLLVNRKSVCKSWTNKRFNMKVERHIRLLLYSKLHPFVAQTTRTRTLSWNKTDMLIYYSSVIKSKHAKYQKSLKSCYFLMFSFSEDGEKGVSADNKREFFGCMA